MAVSGDMSGVMTRMRLKAMEWFSRICLLHLSISTICMAPPFTAIHHDDSVKMSFAIKALLLVSWPCPRARTFWAQLAVATDSIRWSSQPINAVCETGASMKSFWHRTGLHCWPLQLQWPLPSSPDKRLLCTNNKYLLLLKAGRP